jgi:hypothetical protein
MNGEQSRLGFARNVEEEGKTRTVFLRQDGSFAA